jgi:hypothetical protein
MVAMACALPGASDKEDSVQQTANALATSLVGDVPDAAELQQTVESMAATTVAQTAEALIVEPPDIVPDIMDPVVPGADIPHDLIPKEPPVVCRQTLWDIDPYSK